MSFRRVKEDFTCEHCGHKVKGTGYTNHCPKCYWSKHVDKDSPGDRASDCHGLMKPIGWEKGPGDIWIIIQRCEKCGHKWRQKVNYPPAGLLDELY